MFTRIFLAVSGLAWLGYGIYCLLAPEQLAMVAGIAANAPHGITELRAMYGGVQAAIGLAALLGAIRPEHARWSLQFQAVIFAGLAPVRLLSALTTGEFSQYTVGAIGFEVVFLIIALVLLRSRPASA